MIQLVSTGHFDDKDGLFGRNRNSHPWRRLVTGVALSNSGGQGLEMTEGSKREGLLGACGTRPTWNVDMMKDSSVGTRQPWVEGCTVK